MNKPFLCLLFLALSPTAFAERGCPEANGIIRTECLERQLKAAEADLKKVLGKAIASIGSKENDFIPPQEREKWQTAAANAQRSWRAYRDTECQTITPYFWWGGSGVSGAVVECSLWRTEARIKELRERYGIK